MQHNETKKNNPVYVSGKTIRGQYEISTATLQRWANEGKIDAVKTAGGHRLYDSNKVNELFGFTQQKEKKKLCYARVSSTKQKKDLQRQVDCLKQLYPEHTIIEDIGSGLNYQRKGFKDIVVQVCQGNVEQIVVLYKDRLCRFGFELMQQICESHDTKLLVHHKTEEGHHTYNEELSEDLLSIITYYTTKNNGKRSAINKKRRRDQESKEENQSKRKKFDQSTSKDERGSRSEQKD